MAERKTPAKASENSGAKKYVLLRDRRPKNDTPTLELPSGAVLKFKSVLDFKDGELWEALGTLQAVEHDVSSVPEAIRALSLDPDENFRVMSEEEGWSDADTVAMLQDIGGDIFEAIGSLGELEG